jgi:HlyD family secretion protein
MLREVSGAGSLEPKYSRWITTLTPARVEAILVKPGSPVKADTVIMELSQPNLLDESAAAQADLKAFEADVTVRRLGLENQLLDQRAVIAAASSAAKSAQLQADAEAQLHDAHVIPELQFQRNAMAAASAAAKYQLEQQRLETMLRGQRAQASADAARLEQKRATAALRQHQVEALKVRAAIDGVLQQVAVEVGQQISEGGNLARVAKLDDLIVHLHIPEVEASALRNGQAVRIDTRNGLVQGALSRIDPTVSSGTVMVDVELHGALPPGTRLDQNVIGVVEIERLHDVLYVRRPSQSAALSSGSLFKLDPRGNAAVRTPVRFGRASANNIEIVSGLIEGDRVILSDLSQWEKSDRLRLD